MRGAGLTRSGCAYRSGRTVRFDVAEDQVFQQEADQDEVFVLVHSVGWAIARNTHSGLRSVF
jgi:hypothetical protein